MPKAFVYVGKDESSPDQVKVRGLTFERDGEPVTVLDEAVANGLSGNPEFKEAAISEFEYAELPEEALPDEVIASLTARIEELESKVGVLLAAAPASQEDPSAEPAQEQTGSAGPSDYTQANEIEATFAEIEESDDWSKEHHSTRIKWANVLAEDKQVATAAEADEIILGALVDREQDQD